MAGALLLGFLIGLFVCAIITYIYTEPKAEGPKPVMDSETWASIKALETDASRHNEYVYDLQSKMQILENGWLDTHPCYYRKGLSEDMGTIGMCKYPTPEDRPLKYTDMFSRCSKCKVRKEPGDKV